MPREEGEAAQGETPLKVNFLVEEKLKMRPDGPTDNELSNMFFTTKHTWRPRPREDKLKPKNIPVDRDGL
ncbi:hypothetical protein C0Q70_14790 [Pomacea canaliculata]|uniref:Uncharacterized protein n=2 Tax=Pomacea canaliculata TaxID=400727 RepID=A0A2T7NT27_POMCA|nr:hypothetical protein C0Q70_14790 [Pomacea canaliculata]